MLADGDRCGRLMAGEEQAQALLTSSALVSGGERILARNLNTAAVHQRDGSSHDDPTESYLDASGCNVYIVLSFRAISSDEVELMVTATGATSQRFDLAQPSNATSASDCRPEALRQWPYRRS